MKVALIHDWIIYMRGAERVLEAFCELYPDADLYTLFHRPGTVSPTIEDRRITTSMIQRFPLLHTRYGSYLPLFPLAIERFDLRGYDLVLSSSHCVAKGVITAPETCHISYLHTPMLYVWDDFHHYFPHDARFSGFAALFTHYLKFWDATSASRVDYFVTISRYLARRVLKRYRRRAAIIYPPVATTFYSPGDQDGDFFLVVSALVPRKHIDLAIQAFNRLGLPLKIAGRGWGNEERRLRKMAGPNVEFLGWLDEESVRDYYRRCRALILPGSEDFGIASVEAQACGKPVIAYGKGAALETIIPVNPQKS
jgi:glycosyltransferase involved in cell wall biosynthesis